MPLGRALRVITHPNQNNYPRTTAGCGAMFVAGGSEKYVLAAVKSVQHAAKLEMPQGYCAKDPQLSHLPVVLFHDQPNITSDMLSRAMGGEKPLFEAFYIGSAEHPIMDKFEPIPKVFDAAFKWYRPQLFQLSPFQITLSIDDDAVPCSGAKLAEAFKFFNAKSVAVMAPKHFDGLNMGVVMFDTEMARPWAAAWAEQLKKCIEKHGGIKADQPAMTVVIKKHLVSVANFNDHNVCRRAVRTKGCASESCWIDHRSGSTTIENKLGGATLNKEEMPELTKDSMEEEQRPGQTC